MKMQDITIRPIVEKEIATTLGTKCKRSITRMEKMGRSLFSI